jgi:hypothetical protein
MAWTFNASGTASNGNNASSLTPGLPAGWAAGDLHILVFSNYGGTDARAPQKPDGWNSIGGDNGWNNADRAGSCCAVYWRLAQAGDGAPTLTLSGTGVSGDTQLSRIHGFRPAYKPGLINVTGSTSTNASADNVGAISGIDPDVGDLALIVAAKTNDWNGTATLASWTLATQNESTTGNDAGNALLYQLASDGAATGNLTVADNGGTASNGLGFGILVTFRETKFADVRQAIINHIDSAQSEAHGWDADVKAACLADLTCVVRTSDTVVTVTLPAVSTYDITAQETITATAPAEAVAGGADIIATPTFTVDPGTGAQAVTTPTVASTAALYAMAVAVGAVTLSAPAIASGGQVFAPTVQQVVAAPTIPAGSILYAPTVAPGAVAVILPTIASGEAPYSPTVAPGAVELAAPFIDSSEVLYEPSVIAGEGNAYPPSIASTAALYAPSLTVGPVALALPTIASGSVLYAPNTAYVILAPTLASGSVTYAPGPLTQIQSLSVPFISSGAQTYAPGLIVGPVALTLPFLASGAQLDAPMAAYAIGMPAIVSAALVVAPATSYAVGAPTIGSGSTIFAPAIAVGAVAVNLPTIASGSMVWRPSLILPGHLIDVTANQAVYAFAASARAFDLLASWPGHDDYDRIILAAAPLAYWDCNEKTGLIAHDRSGYGRDANITGGVTLGEPGLSPDSTAFRGNGSSGIVTGPAIALPATFSFECLFKPAAAQYANIRLLGEYGAIPARLTLLAQIPAPNNYDCPYLYWNGVGSGRNTSLVIGSWVHLVGVADGTKCIVYVDTVPAGPSGAYSTPPTLSALCFLGGQGTFANGWIQRVSVYDYALSPTQVAAHFAALTAGLVVRSASVSSAAYLASVRTIDLTASQE